MKTTSRIPLRRSLAAVFVAALLAALALAPSSSSPAQAQTELPTVQFNTIGSSGGYNYSLAESTESGTGSERHGAIGLSAVSAETVTVQYSIGPGGDNPASGCPVGTSFDVCNNSDLYDFQIATHTATFSADSTGAKIEFVHFGDLVDEKDETFLITLSAPTNATLGTATQLTVTIQDNDPTPTVTLALAPPSISESGGVSTVTASLDRPSAFDTTVTVSAAAVSPATAGDFILSTNRTLTIPALATASTGVVTVSAVDNVAAADKTVTVSGTAGNTHGIVEPLDAVLTIQFDPNAPPSVSIAAGVSPVIEGTAAQFTLTRTRAVTNSLTVNVTVSESGDAVAAGNEGSVSATFLVGSPTAALSVATEDDDVMDDDSAVTATVSPGAGYVVGAPSAASVTVQEDAPARTGITVWSGTMTAGTYPPNTTFGFVQELDAGSLDDTTFFYGDANHTISSIAEIRTTDSVLTQLRFSLADAGLGDVSGLTLHVGGKSFDFSDATFDSTFFLYTWTDPGLGWSDGDTVFLEIIEEVSPELRLVYNPKDSGDGTVAILHEPVQGFTTGPNPYGYELSNVRIAFHSLGLPATYQPQHMEVRIRADNGGVPGTTIHTMTNPSSLTAGYATFAAPEEARLDPDTTYFVGVRYGTGNVRVQSTTLDTEYASGSGWTIANHALHYVGIEQTLTPVSGSKAILLQISGRALLPPPLPPEGAMWSGTMKVGHISQASWFGYAPDVLIGSLDDTTFFHGGATHTIDGISERREGSNTANLLYFSLADAGLGDVSDLTLHVGGKSFDFSDATFDSTGLTYTWTDPGLNWSFGDTASLEVINDAPPEFWSADMTVSGNDGHKVYGYSHWPPTKRVPRPTTIGAITDGDLKYDGATHIVTEVRNFRRDDGNDLRFTTETTEGGGLGDVSDLRLVVDGYERPFSDARRVGARTYIWDNTPGLAWSDGDTVSLSIIQRVGLPTAPPSLKAVGGLRLAALSWPAPEDDGNRPITGYEVRYALSGEAYPDAWTPAPGGYHDRDRTAVVEGLEAGTEYTFEVRARNKMGAGPAAESATARTAVAGATAQSAARAVIYPRSALDADQTGQYLLVDWRDEDAQGRPLCATGYDVYISLGEWGWLGSGDPIAVDPGHSTRNMPPLGTFRHHGNYGSDVTEEQVRVVCDDGDGRLIGEVTARRGSALPPWGGTGNQGALLPEVTLTTAETTAAEGAALEFTLTRSGPTEEALGVDVRVSETGAMLAVFPSRAVIPAGQDRATFAVLTLDDEAVEADSVVTATLAEDAERYTVGAPFSASVTVMDDDRAPLTAEFLDAPESHNGEDAFALRIAFSEAVAVSYRTLRDHALEVTGGRVREAKRVDGRSDLWEITIAPDGDGGVNVVLPVTDSCDDQGAICTGDGGALSNRVELTISGPVAEEEDGQAQEQQQEEERTPPENSAATGAPAITGTAQVGETLTADTSGIADADGLDNAAFSYQWLADDADIQGATGSTYTLQDADEGKAVTVRVSFDDDAGNQESLTSGATAGVEAAVAEEEPVEPPPAPTNLTAVVNEDGSVTLTWDAPDDDSVTGYQVLRRRPYEGEKTLLVYVENTGSTATVFTDADVTAGTQHVYRVKAVNDAGAGGQSNYVNADVPDAEADDSASSDEPKPPSREEVPDSDPDAEQQSGQAANPRAPELVDSILGRIRIRLFPVEGATRYEVTRIKLLRTGHAGESTSVRSIQHSDAPIYTDHDIEWGRRYIYYYRARFGNSHGSYSNGSVKVTSEEEPHVTNRRIVRFKLHSGGAYVWQLSYRWNAPTGDAVGDLLGYTVEQWYNGRVTVTELGPRSTRWDGAFAAAPGSGLGTQYRIKVRYSTGETAWSPYTISCVDESECATTSYEEVGGYETS